MERLEDSFHLQQLPLPDRRPLLKETEKEQTSVSSHGSAERAKHTCSSALVTPTSTREVLGFLAEKPPNLPVLLTSRSNTPRGMYSCHEVKLWVDFVQIKRKKAKNIYW